MSAGSEQQSLVGGMPLPLKNTPVALPESRGHNSRTEEESRCHLCGHGHQATHLRARRLFQAQCWGLWVFVAASSPGDPPNQSLFKSRVEDLGGAVQPDPKMLNQRNKSVPSLLPLCPSGPALPWVLGQEPQHRFPGPHLSTGTPLKSKGGRPASEMSKMDFLAGLSAPLPENFLERETSSSGKYKSGGFF